MSSIEELQGRISVALARIGSGVETLAQRSASAEPDPDLARALAEEQQTVAQIKERLRQLNLKHIEETESLKAQLNEARAAVPETGADQDLIAELRAQMTAQAEALAKLDGDMQRVRHANDALRKSNAALREANEAGVGEPDLINKAMLAELESLRAARALDMSEAGAVLARLEPLLKASAQSEGELT
ncbi:hypothetical protein GI582_18865 [Sulfitobacter sp. BDSS02]|uniref:hypothetical protein n=1 Tax=Heliomarina TaxID=2917553 RepID=UPI001EE1E9BA|nr:hypothetical protein [Heliomarina baculiformis]MBL3704766.1 hypothetical protein [Sulfitobacter sp. BDSS02]MBR9850371.1 hypothetical protein [Paracoccaceae bacterium]